MESGYALERLKDQRGVAAVEFAIVLPVVMLLMLATAELGRAFYQYNTLTKAVENGARYLADNAFIGSTYVIDDNIGSSDKGLNARNLVVYGKISGGSVPVLENLSIGNISVAKVDADHISVSATYTYTPMFMQLPMFGFGPDVATEFNFQASVIMRALL